ncbi:MAG: 50S ribosomal protein L13 [Selenomonadaceae bacterium]|nr:50S ribosomal protein L13 [Selenomonadaceae bacterium]
MAKSEDMVGQRKWYLVDAAGKTVGRMATEIAKILRGKDKPNFTPHVDTGDFVIVINAEKAAFTGRKFRKKLYFHHTGYLGGAKFASAGEWMKKFPERVIEHAVKGMLPKNKLGADMFRKLHVYKSDKHPHAAQKPELLELNDIFVSKHAQQLK